MPFLLLSMAACFWGGNYVVGHLLVAHSDPIVLSAARWSITAILLMIIYFKQVKIQWPEIKRAKNTVLLLALCGQVIFPLTLYIGLQYTTSLKAAICLSATPTLVLLINRIIFRESISIANVAGVVLSSLGVIWLVTEGSPFNAAAFNHLNQGDIWALISAISWAVYCAFLRTKPSSVGGHAFVAVSATLGALILMPILFASLIIKGVPDTKLSLSLPFLSGLAYLVIFPSWLSYVLWNRGIAAIGATRGEIFSHIIPLSGGLFSITFLDMHLSMFHIISAVLIISGIACCSKESGKRKQKKQCIT